MLKRLHPIAGVIGLVMILTFWLSTAVSELSGNIDLIVAVKRAIPWGFILLIPALIATGASGFRLGGKAKAPLILAKKARMPFIAANGILLLVPSALVLRHLAIEGQFGTLFVVVQAVELCAGALNVVLMSLSMRDGLRLKGRLRRA